jgi:hypothetical protein
MNRLNINWEAVIILLLFISLNFLPGWLQFYIIIINIFSFIVFSFILIKIANLKHYNNQKNIIKNVLNRNNGILTIMLLGLFGLFIGIYDLYIFYKNPLRKKYNDLKQQNRDKKIKKLGI